MVTRSELLKFAPKANPVLVDAIIKNWHVAEKAGIKTPRRISALVAGADFFGGCCICRMGVYQTLLEDFGA